MKLYNQKKIFYEIFLILFCKFIELNISEMHEFIEYEVIIATVINIPTVSTISHTPNTFYAYLY